MKYLLGGVSILISSALIGAVAKWAREEKTEKKNLVRLPKILLIVGVAGAAFFMIPILVILCSGDSDNQPTALVFVAFALLSVSLIIAYMNCRIVFGNESFEYKNFFGIKKTIYYKDLTGMKGGSRDVKLYVGKKVINIDELATNRNEFLARAHSGYKRYHEGATLPSASKKDIFLNHVESPGEFIFAFSLIAVICLGLTIFMLVSEPEKKENYEAKQVVAERYEIIDGDLIIYTGENEKFVLSDYEKNTDDSAGLVQKVKEKNELELMTFYFQNDGEPYYRVGEIRCDSNIYMSFERFYETQVKNHHGVIIAVLCIDVIVGVYIGLSIYVGRNPHKFSDKVLHLFFKPGYIHRY